MKIILFFLSIFLISILGFLVSAQNCTFIQDCYPNGQIEDCLHYSCINSQCVLNDPENIDCINQGNQDENKSVCGDGLCDSGEGKFCDRIQTQCNNTCSPQPCRPEPCASKEENCRILCPTDCTITADIKQNFKLKLWQQVKFNNFDDFELELVQLSPEDNPIAILEVTPKCDNSSNCRNFWLNLPLKSKNDLPKTMKYANGYSITFVSFDASNKEGVFIVKPYSILQKIGNFFRALFVRD